MKQIVMIGTPLTHVSLPQLINQSLLQHDCEMTTVEVTPEALPAFVQDMRRPNGDVVGLVVTTPLKQLITADADLESPIVTLVGAANAIRFDKERWCAANFDGLGFVSSLLATVGAIDGCKILLVGCGGAGTAIAASLVTTANLDLSIFDIDHDKAEAFSAALRIFAPNSRVVALNDIVGADIVINASTRGMIDGDPSPIAEEVVAEATVVADILTGRGTALKKMARTLGKPVVDGEMMVSGQAEYLRRFFFSDAESESEILAM